MVDLLSNQTSEYKFCSAQISEDNPNVGYKPEINLKNNKPVKEKIDQILILKKPVSQ